LKGEKIEMECCDTCLYIDDCTPKNKMNVEVIAEDNWCNDYMEAMDLSYCLIGGECIWKEMSYNRYSEDGKDYGEFTEWDSFIDDKTATIPYPEV
jgi:hypothetical protein